jgi:endonuclease/exonuclease/phosphatase family metal-dependent hydrolase
VTISAQDGDKRRLAVPIRGNKAPAEFIQERRETRFMKARVLTVSVEDFDMDDERLAVLNAELRRIAPDIAVMQKVIDPKFGRLEKWVEGTGLQTTHQAEVLRYSPKSSEWGGNVVATRWNHEVVEVFEATYQGGPSTPWCTLAAVVQVPDEGEMLFIATTGAGWANAEWVRERQVIQLTDLDARHRRELPTIIAGDFNAGPHSSTIRFLRGEQSLDGHSVWYHDAWDVAGQGPGFTWTVDNEAYSYRQNRRVSQPNYRRRIDYVFIAGADAHPNTHCSVESAFLSFAEPVDGIWPSDHLGVTVDVEIGHGAGTLGHVADPAGEDWRAKLAESSRWNTAVGARLAGAALRSSDS